MPAVARVGENAQFKDGIHVGSVSKAEAPPGNARRKMRIGVQSQPCGAAQACRELEDTVREGHKR